MEQLDLSENKITSLNDLNHFKWLVNLKLLMLNGNLILNINFDVLTGLNDFFNQLTSLEFVFIDFENFEWNDYFYLRNKSCKFFYDASQFDKVKNMDFKLNSD